MSQRGHFHAPIDRAHRGVREIVAERIGTIANGSERRAKQTKREAQGALRSIDGEVAQVERAYHLATHSHPARVGGRRSYRLPVFVLGQPDQSRTVRVRSIQPIEALRPSGGGKIDGQDREDPLALRRGVNLANPDLAHRTACAS